MRRLIVRPAVLLVLAGGGAFACSEPNTPFAVVVNPGSTTLDAVGATRQLSAVVQNEKGKELLDASVSWSTSAGTVATVSETGLVTAAGSGTADVTATAGPASGKAAITVSQTVSTAEATSGAQQTGVVGTQLPQALTVRVRDRLGAGIPGLGVTFTVSTDGGSVSPSNATTDAQGLASTTWTFGIKSGSHQVTATLSAGLTQTVTFSGRAHPGPASILTKAGGDGQYGYQGSRLDTLVQARVRDQYGNGVPSHPVQFATDAGNGTADSAIAFTDSTGVARSGWVMPGAIDTVALQVASLSGSGSPLLGSPATFTAISHNVRVTAVSPTTLAEGQSTTLTGSGFDAGNTQNVVTIDGVAAAVTAATASDLSVTVPAYDCKPARNVAVQVTVAGIPAAPVTVPLNPAAAALTLAVGQQTIVGDPAQFCFQFGAQATQEAYLIGVQSTSEVASTLTPITLIGTGVSTGAAAAAASPRLGVQAAQATSQAPRDARLLERLRRHRAAELDLRAFDRQMFPVLRASALRAAQRAAAPAAVVPGTAQVGDTVQVRVISSLTSCTGYTEIKTVVRAKGTNGFFLADVANPVGGFTSSQFTGFSDQYDAKIYPTDVAQFGAATDRDANSRIVVVVTKEANRLGPIAFTSGCDLADRATYAASNEGEFFYVAAPDPAGAFGDTLALAFATEYFPVNNAHESVHVIQLGRRAAAGAAEFLDLWVTEGQARMGEELAGHAILGNVTGANYSIDHVLTPDGRFVLWYAFVDLGLYFGWYPTLTNPNGRVENAPWECTFLATGYGGPCVGGLEIYGPSWSLLRHLSDRYGPTYTGGEAGIQKAIIESPQTGFAMLKSVIGVSADTLLAHWAAMLYADDITNNWASLAPALSLASWDLDDIFYGSAYGYSHWPSARLTPVEVAFSTFSKSAKVRAASAYYAVIYGSNRLPVAVKARDGVGGILGSHMRYWIVRIE